jgi:hypothetical protein
VGRTSKILNSLPSEREKKGEKANARGIQRQIDENRNRVETMIVNVQEGFGERQAWYLRESVSMTKRKAFRQDEWL